MFYDSYIGLVPRLPKTLEDRLVQSLPFVHGNLRSVT